MEAKRIHWIDIARGIGIIFVIYAHVLGSHGYRYLFYAFHMPLFFFLSGVVFKKYDSFQTFFKKSVKGLLIPYFAFAFITYFLWIIGQNRANILSSNNIVQFLSIFYGNSNYGLMAFNDVLWFLPALFLTRIMFAALFKLSEKTKNILLILFLFSVFGYLFSIFAPNIKFPFGLETAFSAVVFYGAGVLWNRSEKAKEYVIKYKYFIFPAFVILGAILATIDFNSYGHQIDMRLDYLNNYFFFYTDALLGTFAWIAFSIILNKNNLLETIGRNSLILFAWHPIVFNYLRLIVTTFINSEIIKNIMALIPAIYTIIAISVILFANSLIDKLSRFRKIFP